MAIEFFTQRTMENSDRFFKQRTNARPMIYAYEDAVPYLEAGREETLPGYLRGTGSV